IYANIKKSVQFLLSCNLGEIIAVFTSMLIWHISPLSAIQLLWVNLVTDGLPALALGVEPIEKDIMQRSPRKKDESLFAHGLGFGTLYQGIMIGGLTLIAFALGKSVDIETAKTMAFLTLAFSQLVQSFNARSNNSLFKVGLFTNKWLFGAVAVSAILMLVVVLTPISAIFGLSTLGTAQVVEVALLSIAPLFICEAVKLITSLFKKK
ncbi:MAG: cation-translocating P-type ATPase, partial [Clostridia bacterium]|nr:cation-translocating P-type ATPase [Clostridia bacterium]